MKRMLSILAVVALVAMTVQAVEVKSENVAGVVNVSIAAGDLAIVGINMEAFDAADDTLEGVLGGKLLAGAFPGDGDVVLMWNSGDSKYESFQISTSDGLFHAADDLGEWFAGPTNPAVVPGDAFWIQASGSGDVDLSLTGQAVDAASSSVQVHPGLQFLSYPLSSKISLASVDFVSDGATQGPFPGDGDEMLFWTGSEYQSYGLKNDGQWYPADDLGEWFGPAATGDIELGVGFWYNSKAGSTWNWTEDSLYDQNL